MAYTPFKEKSYLPGMTRAEQDAVYEYNKRRGEQDSILRNRAGSQLTSAGLSNIEDKDIDRVLAGESPQVVAQSKNINPNNKLPTETVQQWQTRTGKPQLPIAGTNLSPDFYKSDISAPSVNPANKLLTETFQEWQQRTGVAPPVSTTTSSAIVPAIPATSAVSTGNAQLDELYKTLKEFVSGKTLNPNIQLTPADLQRFYDQAAQEINPYYASQISAIKDDLTKSIGFLQKNYELEKEQAGAQLKNTLASSREAAAGAGTIFSGARGRQERNLADLYNQNLENRALGLENQIGGTLRAAESKIGSKNIQDLGIPSFQSSGVSLEGEGGLTPGRTLSFAPSGGITGSTEYQQRGDIRSLQDLLSGEEIKKRSRTNIGGLYL